jgi:hypothetical protein
MSEMTVWVVAISISLSVLKSTLLSLLRFSYLVLPGPHPIARVLARHLPCLYGFDERTECEGEDRFTVTREKKEKTKALKKGVTKSPTAPWRQYVISNTHVQRDTPIISPCKQNEPQLKIKKRKC